MSKRLSYLPVSSFLFILGLTTLLGGCVTSSQSTFQEEDFESANTFSRSFPGTPRSICEAARRALLSQGYIIQEARDESVKGRKNFQPTRDNHVQIEFNVVCAPNSPGSNSSTAFANALQDQYSLKKSTNSASVGVGVLGSLSLPFGSSDESMVKTGSETISKGRFYKSFFALMERYLDLPSGSSNTKETKEEPAAEEHDSGTTD